MGVPARSTELRTQARDRVVVDRLDAHGMNSSPVRFFLSHDEYYAPDPNTLITPEHADQLAERAHGQDRTKSGTLFIEHVRRVAAYVASDPDPYAIPAALLHDVVEKGSVRWADLRAAGADDRLVAVIDALTERENEHEHDYLARCAADPLALRIKRADVGDKLAASSAATTVDVPTLHAQANQRLDLLERFARQHAPF